MVIDSLCSVGVVLSDFFEAREEGVLEGRCVVCGRVGRGFPARFPESFTAYAWLQGGSIICSKCKAMLENQDLRRRSWVAFFENGKPVVRFLSRNQVLNVLLNPPNPPFAIYVTRTGKKQGYLQLANRVSFSRNIFYVAFDDLLINVRRDVLEKYVKLARKALALGFRKKDLTGGCSVKAWLNREVCFKIEKVRGDPLWELVVWAV